MARKADSGSLYSQNPKAATFQQIFECLVLHYTCTNNLAQLTVPHFQHIEQKIKPTYLGKLQIEPILHSAPATHNSCQMQSAPTVN